MKCNPAPTYPMHAHMYLVAQASLVTVEQKACRSYNEHMPTLQQKMTFIKLTWVSIDGPTLCKCMKLSVY